MLGQRIKEIRLAFGWNQVQLAKKLNITKQTVSNWENDNIQPSVEMLIKLTTVFKTSADYLLGLSSENIISVDGLPADFVSHIVQVIDDYKSK